jgi:hypothetical protein
MGSGKDLKKRKKKIRVDRNPFIVIDGKKRFMCKNHGLVSEKDTYMNRHSGDRVYGQCRICSRISVNKHYQVNRKKYCDLSEEEKSRYIKKQQKSRIKTNYAEKQKIRDKVNSEELRDPYVKYLIQQRMGIPAKEIPMPLIEVYRAIVKIKRIKYQRI